jgi:hypothetical protein
VVQELSQQFQGRLSEVFFLFRHVQIIYKYHTLFAHWRTKNAFPTFLEFTINSVLSAIGTSLGRESEGNILEIVAHFLAEESVEVE